jgi:hypothetical protein
VEDHGQASFLQDPVDREELGMVHRKSPVDGVKLEAYRTGLQLALEVLHQRVVQVRVKVSEETEAARVVGHHGQEVLIGMDPYGAEAVLGKQQDHVHPFIGEEGLDRLRNGSSIPIVEARKRRFTVFPSPLEPEEFERLS